MNLNLIWLGVLEMEMTEHELRLKRLEARVDELTAGLLDIKAFLGAAMKVLERTLESSADIEQEANSNGRA